MKDQLGWLLYVAVLFLIMAFVPFGCAAQMHYLKKFNAYMEDTP